MLRFFAMSQAWVVLGVMLAACGRGVAEDAAAAPPPVVTFAAVADIQYANKDMAGTRGYRQSPAKLAAMAAELAKQKPAPAFIVGLGDFTDGQNGDKKKAEADVAAIAAAIKRVPLSWKFVLGNHDAAAGRELLAEPFGFREFHYEFTVPGAKGWRFVVLDGNDAGYGIISKEQLAWFKGVLDRAKAGGERVICFCHFPLLKEASPRDHRMAKPEPVLETMDQAGCVAAWIAGHDHLGGYASRNGVHHLTLQGMVETKDTPAFAVIRIFPDHLSVSGFGRVPSRELPLAAAPVPSSR